jgi:hypothetical protein
MTSSPSPGPDRQIRQRFLRFGRLDNNATAVVSTTAVALLDRNT